MIPNGRKGLLDLFVSEYSKYPSPARERSLAELCILTLVTLEGGTGSEADEVWKRLQARQIPSGPLTIFHQIMVELMDLRLESGA